MQLVPPEAQRTQRLLHQPAVERAPSQPMFHWVFMYRYHLQEQASKDPAEEQLQQLRQVLQSLLSPCVTRPLPVPMANHRRAVGHRSSSQA
jgi:hypothetical protein